MDLFEYMRSANMEKESPLAARMRPRTLDEVVGQEHIIGKDKLLYRAIKADKICIDQNVYKGALIALSPTPVSDNGTYSAIIALDA